MADKQADPTTSGTSGAGSKDGEGQRRKIGGKYNSVEDAVEELIKTRDSGFHETREELGAIKQLLERVMTPIGSRGTNDYSDDYRRGRSNDDEDQEFDAAEFLSSPQRVLKRRESKMMEKFQVEQERKTALVIGNAATVLRFQMKNPDLDDHEHIVQSFLEKTNPRDPLSKRLTEAGKATRVYLAKLKGSDQDDDEGDNGRAPNKDEYVEGTSRGGQGNGRQKPSDDDDSNNANKEPTEDSELGDYLKERRQFKTSRFQAPQGK